MIEVKGTEVKYTYSEIWVGAISASDLMQSTRQVEALLHQDNRLDKDYVLIIDITRLASLPSIKTLKDATKTHPKETSHIVLYGDSLFFTTIARMIGGATGYDIQVVKTREEAIEKAREILKQAEQN